ncbi:sacsin-like [Cololabis saira]|uniref:sacsin-like n=1 Tax=Cololabis saira TaxID=129043 RepID=UPI002AD2DB43|nr:sacsin-like [Cololabis saira]
MSQKKKNKARTAFGATAPPFLDYLKDILRRYPDGGQILKELIQNADDAQATKVVFIHDERSYGTDSLWTDELRKYQGPALYVYNNADFTDEDWDRIQKAGRSGKLKDPNKIGRFGIGFNSVYHITDVPSIFSSGHLGLMDPQENIFGERNGGFRWYLDDDEHQEALMTMRDQFQPFRDMVSLVGGETWTKVIKEDQYFAGTIFRFPLRNEASEISDNLYTSNKVVELFDSFIADADLNLLFLKNVSSVSVIHVSADGTINTRLEVKSSVPKDVLKSEDASAIESLTRFKQITLRSEEIKETSWLLTTCTLKEGNVNDLDVLAKKLSFLPRVDLAFSSSDRRDCDKGRLSCFLPLPNNDSNKTGLPVYANACFGLTDNRRHIKWQEEDQKHDEHALWNELLVKEVLPQAYVTIIQDTVKLAQKSLLPVSSVYNLWPDVSQMQHKDKWLDVARDVFNHLFSQNVAVLSLAEDERKFIPLSEAVLPCNGPMSATTLSAIKRALVSRGENLVTLPASVARAIEAYPHTTPKRVTPSFLREVFRRTGMHSIGRNDKLCLLEYILNDEKYREVEGLQLVPLSDGSFRFFTKREEDTALIDSEEFPRILLPYCNHLFISDDLSPTCRAHLRELAGQKFFKVINIDSDDVAEYTRRYLPQDWKQPGKTVVTWSINSGQHPPLDWLQEFWKFLNNHFQELSGFTEIPLVPISPLSASQPAFLAKLQRNTTLIFQKSKQSSLPEQMAELLTKVGGTVVRGNEWLKHGDLDSYVLSPSPNSVMKVLLNLDSQHLIKTLKSEPQRTREELKEHLSHLNPLSSREKDLLLTLPLFQTMKGSCVPAHSKKAVLLTAGPAVPAELPMPDSVIQCATEADRRLLSLLKVNILGPADAAMVLVDCMERETCSNEEIEKTMTWILQNGNILFAQNPSLKSRCRNLKFIQMNGELKKPSSFLDPRNKTFKVIFESCFFPPPVYTETTQMLESLTDLGLIKKEADVTPEHLLHATTQIDNLRVDSKNEALKRAQAVLGMLDSSDLLSKFSDKQLHQLKVTKWVGCEQPGNDNRELSEESEGSCFYCPDEIRHTMYKDIVGHVIPLTGKLNDRVSRKLGLSRPPPPEKVIENLLVLTSKAQEMADPDTNVDFKTQLHQIYKHMQEHMSTFAQAMNKNTPWLWAHKRFVPPQELVLFYPHDLDLSSYIGKLPNEFLPYRTLLQRFGLRTSLSNEEIVGILHHIHESIEARQEPFASPSEVKASIEILNWLWREKKTVQGDVPVPVITEGEQFTLKPRSEALLCDLSKERLKEYQFSTEEMYVLHEEIPIATAEWLKIRFLSNFILAPELVGIEQCGQSEPITTRIKNILNEYDEQSDIFKELIQNAEDAGAETCKFLVDFRAHKASPESLIDPDMALCQGPCLWAFNNEQFTPEDWENIVRVGSASKENKVEKIGKFGLGFNTVYHVTDVPSILSGTSLLILDPNVTHLKKHIHSKGNPGIKLNLSQKRIVNCFPGQFAPYEHIFGCNFTTKSPPEAYPGTLIKLPFRTQEEAIKSEISTRVYHKDAIMALQHNFEKNSKTHLLFLKNVNTLSLQSISNNVATPPRDDEMETILTVSKTVMREMRTEDENTDSKQLHAEESLVKLDSKCRNIINSNTINIIKVTSQQSGETEDLHWLLYNCFGTDRSLEMALQKDNQAKFSLPIGGIALPLQRSPETGKLSPLKTDLVGQAFCFLPLPIQTGLPVNVNGTFAMMSNRKALWESGMKGDWNKALLQGPVAAAYVTALLALKKMCENQELESYSYHTFWPNRANVGNTFKPLVDVFYSAIAQHSTDPELFSDGEKWCSMSNAIFLQESIQKDKKISPIAAQVCKTYLKEPKCVVPLPSWLANSFKLAGLKNVLQSRTWSWAKFYEEIVFNNLATMDAKCRDALVLHAIDLNIKDIDKLLVSHPCIPTTDGQLQYVKKLVSPSCRMACLFEPEEGRLLGGTKDDFCAPKRIQRLLELGMAHDSLTLEDITQKAKTMTDTWRVNKKKACDHLKCLLDLMKNHMDDGDSHHWETLRRTPFLPAFSPGDLKMTGNVTLQKPTAVFKDKFALLVNMEHHVLDHKSLTIHSHDPILDFLGVQNSPETETVLQQLQEAYSQSQSTDKSMLHEIAYECYKFLDQWTGLHMIATVISQRANSFPFILVRDTFVPISCVAEKHDFDAKPYLHVLPPAFTGFRNLWKTVGVEERFATSQFLTVLQELHSRYGNTPLPANELSICLTILAKGLFEAKEKVPEICPIPNFEGVLQPATELRYNDSPWMPVPSDVTLCHEHIPRVMAEHFGIMTTRYHTLENVTSDISPFSFEFAQHEELTVRIKNIISAYPSKKDILKELIQNADDAEATEIHFVWDERHHGKEKTFGEKWNPLQGPALCVFNNKVFSEEDLKGIQQLGEGGKQKSTGKIGKYGVGFNSVYHLTDCPSILTEDKLLCILDPNQNYIENHSGRAKSGIGYDLNDTVKEMYKDVYQSFLPDEFPLKKGTMFRLPLRAPGAKSEISQQVVTDSDMNELCSALSGDPEGLILFLKNICKIKVRKIDRSGKIQTIFEVEKRLSQRSMQTKDAFEEHLQNALQRQTQITPLKALYDATVSTSDKRESKWIIAEQFGSFKEASELQLSSKVPQGAIAARLKAPPYPRNTEFEGAAFCSLPLPGTTGLPVHISGNFEVDSARKNLWKEDGQSQKSNWNKALKQDIIAPLYADLLHCIRCRIRSKKGSLESIELHLSTSYLCFWPFTSEVDKQWHEMILEVYRSIKDKGLNLIPVLRSSTRKIASREFKEYSLDWCNLSETETTKVPYLTDPTSDRIILILEDLGMNLVPFSTEMIKIQSDFKSAGVELKIVSPGAIRAFLQSKPLNDPARTEADLPLPITATLIKDQARCSKLLTFCLKDPNLKELTEQNPNVLNGLPLLLTSDKVLRVFNSESPKFISRYDSLFFDYASHFADHNTNKDHAALLKTANLVKDLTMPLAAEFLKPLVQKRLQSCGVDPVSGLHVPNDTMLKWLTSLWRFIMSEIKMQFSHDDHVHHNPTLSDVRKLLGDCCIVPVVCPALNNKHLLQTMKGMSSVIPYTSEREISSILFKLGFMKLDTVFFSKVHQQANLPLHPELIDVNDKTSVLDQVYNISHSKFSQLSNEDLKVFQTFLQSGLSMSKDKQEYTRKLKSLPLFETTLGDRVRIDGSKEVFVLNSMYSGTFPDLFTLPTSNSIFLKYSLENLSLSEMLKIPVLDDLEYFMKFILPNVHRFTEKQTLLCLKLLLTLCRHLNYSNYKNEIISSMKTVKLIHSCQGKLEPASYYFDATVELYKKMAPKERFVPQKVWTDLCDGDEKKTPQARQLIRELGMKHEVSNDEVINFAFQLETEAKGNSNLKELKEKSKLLFRVALNKVNYDEDGGEKLLKTIADIKFIFPEKIREELCNYHQPFAAGRITVKIRGSLISSNCNHQDLIWSSMPVIELPCYLSQKTRNMMENIGVHDQPPEDCVTSNIRNICQSPCTTEALIKTRAEVFCSSYAHLQRQGFNAQPLAGLPLVLVENDTQLVKADHVCLSLNHDLDFRPYLYQIPSKDAVYKAFFKNVGITDEATARQYCSVLEAVYDDSLDKSQQNRNQLKTVKRAVEQLFHLLKNQGNKVLTGDIKTLHLPAVDGKLYPSCSLYYNDTVFETKRLEEALGNDFLLLEKLSNCHLDSDVYEQHRLVQLLPEKFRPKMLSQITHEKLVDSVMQRCELLTGCDFSGWFERHLSSKEFRRGLICLLRHQSEGKITQEEASKMCDKTFGSIQIVCCDTLETMLWLDEQPLEKTIRETDVFVKREQQGCTFYLRHNDDMSPKVIHGVNMKLTKEINALLGNNLTSTYFPVLGQLLMCDDLQDVQKTLADFEVRDSGSSENLVFSPPATGTDIPEEWHDSLDMNFLNNFEEGEYVGYNINNKYVLAVIVEILPGPKGRYSNRYKIDIGEDEPIEVSHLDLYQFKRERKVKPEGNTSCMELELVVGATPRSTQPTKNPLPTTLDEAKREIDRCLAEIWNFSLEERQKGIKRLYLRWHPDKNPDCESLATEAFKYLKNRVEELTNGKVRTSGPSSSSGSSNYRDFYEQWNWEARSHRSGRERFFRGHSSYNSHSYNYHSYNFGSHNANVPRPNKEEAQRWFRQARCDLDAAQKDTDGGSTEWCLFKVHQAVEKALTAAEYRRNGRQPTSSSITVTAAKVSSYHSQLKDLPQIVDDLRALGVDSKKTQYPNCHPHPHIPNGQFRLENAKTALKKASELLSKVETYVM